MSANKAISFVPDKNPPPILPDLALRYFDYDAYAEDLFRYDYTFVNGYIFSDY